MIYLILFLPFILMIGLNFIQPNLVLKEFQAIFILCSILIIVITYMHINDNYVLLFMPLVLSEIIHFIIMALCGTKLTKLTYKYLLLFTGLIPWIALFTR